MADQDPNAGTNGNGTGGNGKIEFSAEQQAHVDKLVGERGRRADEGLLKDFLKTLGYDKPDEVKTALEEYKKSKESEMSELQKTQARLTEVEPKLTEAQTELSALRLQAALGKALRVQKVEFATPTAEEDALAHLSKNIKTDDKGMPTNLDATLKTLQTDRPYLFKQAGTTEINSQDRGKGDLQIDAAVIAKKYGLPVPKAQ